MKQEEHILHYFKKIHDKVKKRGNANLKEVGLTLAQGHILGYLFHSEGYRASMKELERTAKVAQSTTAGMVARLEANGFVETATDPLDKRIKIVTLTEQGKESIKDVKRSMQQVEAELFVNFTEQELVELKILLEKIAKDNR